MDKEELREIVERVLRVKLSGDDSEELADSIVEVLDENGLFEETSSAEDFGNFSYD